MYRIETTSFGIKITQRGIFSLDEVEKFKNEVIEILTRFDRPFSVLIDSRELVLPNKEVLEVFDQLRRIVWSMSCERGAIVIESPVAINMVKQAITISQVFGNDRMIDSRIFPDWEEIAVNWVRDGIEPPVIKKTEDTLRKR